MQRLMYFALTLLLAVAMSGLPVPAAPADARPQGAQDSTHPVVMQQAGDLVARTAVGVLKPFTPLAPQIAVGGGGGPQREVFGFALASSLSDPSIGYPSWKFPLL